MSQFFSHIPPKAKNAIGKIAAHETHKRTTSFQISGDDLHDLLVHFACERTGLTKAKITSMELTPNVYARTSLDQTLTVIFNEDLS